MVDQLYCEMYHFCEHSKNRKIGEKCGVVQASCVTCAPECPFYYVSLEPGVQKGPCYAVGWPLGMFWRQLSRGVYGGCLDAVAEKVRESSVELVRYGDVGDLPGEGSSIAEPGIRKLLWAFKYKKAWCYTHKPVLFGNNKHSLGMTRGSSFTVNLSAEGWRKPDTLLGLDLGPVVTVLPSDMGGWRRDKTRGGTVIMRCPAEYTDATCSSCGGTAGPLCWQRERKYVVGFTSHGRAFRQLDQRIAEVELGIL